MTKLDIVRAVGASILFAILMGCSSTPAQPGASTQAQARTMREDRTPSWQKYYVSGSRIARRMDQNGKPVSADFVLSTTSEGLQMLPAVTMMPCAKTRSGC